MAHCKAQSIKNKTLLDEQGHFYAFIICKPR